MENKIARVVIGSRDPNPLVAGKGVRFLREHGIEVIEDYLREECDRINPVFSLYNHENAICSAQVRNDSRWKNSYGDW